MGGLRSEGIRPNIHFFEFFSPEDEEKEEE